MMNDSVRMGTSKVSALAGLALTMMVGCPAESVEAGTDGAGGSSSSSTTAAVEPTSTSPTTGAGPTTGAPDSSGVVDESSSSGSLEGSSSGGAIDPPDPSEIFCGATPPDGAAEPPPIPEYSSGMCPPLVPGWNTFASSGDARDVLIVAPSDLQPDEQLPVAILWHWLGGSAEGFVEEADVQTAVDQFRFLAMVPAEKGDLLFRWPFSSIDTDERMEEEFVFFDDMLACAAQSYPIDNTCVSSVGVSAGALFTSQLGAGRSEYLSSIVVLSGGTGGLVKPWAGAEHIMPALVLWGGPEDICIALDFVDTSADLQTNLEADGHVVVECEHNCGHAAPPFESGDPDLTPFAGMWQFFLEHPYWLEDGQTPWAEGTPSTLPEWCSVGVGSSTPRVGECPGGGGC
ncbi:MAG: hypothetical protein AAGA54_05210 [Myxococcota bacterium]